MLRQRSPRASGTLGADRSAGMALAAATAVISGFAVFINGYGLRAWSGIADATTYTTVKNMVAAGVLVALAVGLTKRGSNEGLTRPTTLRQWLSLLAVAVIGGSIPFALFFEGFSQAASAQAAFLHKTLVVWVVILAVVFLRERIGWLHVTAVAVLLWGQAALFGGLGGLTMGRGETLMLVATWLWAVEVIAVKRLLPALSAMTVGVARMAGGAFILVAYGLGRGATVAWADIAPIHVLWVVATGVVLAGYVATWFSALARARAVDVTAILVGGALITSGLNVGIRGLAMPPVTGLVLVGCGVALAMAAMRARSSAPPIQ